MPVSGTGSGAAVTVLVGAAVVELVVEVVGWEGVVVVVGVDVDVVVEAVVVSVVSVVVSGAEVEVVEVDAVVVVTVVVFMLEVVVSAVGTVVMSSSPGPAQSVCFLNSFGATGSDDMSSDLSWQY